MLLRLASISLSLILLFQQEIHAQPSTCVTCISCQDLYDGTDLNASCSTTVPNADSCQKIRIQLPGMTLVSKACAKNCRQQSIVAGTIRLDVSCCTTANCNRATSTTQFCSTLMIVLLFVFL